METISSGGQQFVVGAQPTDAYSISFSTNKLTHKSENPDLTARQALILSEVFALKGKYDLLLEELNADNIEYLQQKRELAVEAAIVARDNYTNLQRKNAELMARNNNLEKEKTDAFFQLDLKLGNRVSKAYSKREDIERYEAEVAELRQKAEAKSTELENHKAVMAAFMRDLNSLAVIHNTATQYEAEVRGQLERAQGKATGEQRDRATGLVLA
jgi:hypothetical protein